MSTHTAHTTREVHPEAQDDEIDLAKLLLTIWRGKWIIALCCFASVIIAADQVFRVETPLYSATASVVLEVDNQARIAISDFDPSLSVDWYTMATQTRILNSRHLAEKVVLSAGLLEDPYFNSHAETDGQGSSPKYGILDLPSMAIGRLRALLRSWMVEPVELSGTDSVETTHDLILTETANAALGAISTVNESDTYVYDITATTPYPETSAILATAWAKAYVQDQRDVKIDETQRTSLWLGDQAASLKVQFEASEKTLASFSSDIDLINAEVLQGLNQQLKLTRDRHQRELETSRDLTAQIDALRQATASGNFEDLPNIMSSAVRNGTLNVTGQTRQQSQEEIASRVLELIAELETTKRGSKQRQTALALAVSDLEGRVSSQSSELVRFEQMSREVEANRVIYEFFLAKMREVSIQSETLQADSRVLSEAVVPNSPVSPRKSRALALATVLGLILGSGIVLLREFLNTNFRTSNELSQATGVLVMCNVPEIKSNSRKEVIDHLHKNKFSHAAEAFRNLRTSLMLSNVDHPPKLIMVTSSIPGEGKTTTSVSLAANFAGLDKKVLLIECDIRRSTFSQIFTPHSDDGLIAVLTGQALLENCIHHDDQLGFDVLFAEKSNISSVDLFSSDKFASFLENVSSIYDFVILDTPPILIVSDARVIAPLSDARLLVAQWNNTSITSVQESLQLLADVGAPVTGLAMTRFSIKGMRSYSKKSSPYYDPQASEYYSDA